MLYRVPVEILAWREDPRSDPARDDRFLTDRQMWFKMLIMDQGTRPLSSSSTQTTSPRASAQTVAEALVEQAFELAPTPVEDDTRELLMQSSLDGSLRAALSRVLLPRTGPDDVRGWVILRIRAVDEEGCPFKPSPCPSCGSSLSDAQRFLNRIARNSKYSKAVPGTRTPLEPEAFVAINPRTTALEIAIEVDSRSFGSAARELREIGESIIKQGAGKGFGYLTTDLGFLEDKYGI